MSSFFGTPNVLDILDRKQHLNTQSFTQSIIIDTLTDIGTAISHLKLKIHRNLQPIDIYSCALLKIYIIKCTRYWSFWRRVPWRNSNQKQIKLQI